MTSANVLSAKVQATLYFTIRPYPNNCTKCRRPQPLLGSSRFPNSLMRLHVGYSLQGSDTRDISAPNIKS